MFYIKSGWLLCTVILLLTAPAIYAAEAPTSTKVPKSSRANLFTVKQIFSSADAGNLEDSRYLAYLGAASKGLHAVLRRMVRADSWSDIPSLVSELENRDILRGIVLECKVTNERMTSHSYSATYDMVLSATDIEVLLNKRGIRYIKNYSGKILLIPILHRGQKYLYKNEPAWFKAWEQGIKSDIGLKLALAPASLDKFGSIEEIINKNFADFGEQADAIDMIVIAFAESLPGSCLELTIRLLSRDDSYNNFTRYCGPSTAEWAVSETVKTVNNYWKGGEASLHEQLYTSEVFIDSLSEWKKINKILNQIKEIKQYYLKSQKNVLVLELEYVVPPPVLANLLRYNNLRVVPRGEQVFLKPGEELSIGLEGATSKVETVAAKQK